MRVSAVHRWDLTPKEAIQVQRDLLPRVVAHNRLEEVRAVAGVDVSVKADRARAAIVVLAFPSLEPVEAITAELPVRFPYVPGLLTFREGPAILAALRKLRSEPDLFLFDGQGLAHPRRLGIATHLGVVMDRPSIGCAKSRLCGTHEEVGPAVGHYAMLFDADEVIGAVLRTRACVRPVYVSVGHKVDLVSAIHFTLLCGAGYRLPEPVRWAHRVAGGGTLPEQAVIQD